ncbi:MAG: lipoyl(octanoyl) transferase LipB [Candidatus Marinimicrobia bacterium]|jgi:lipoyl(octanoyl) transferase|nr:lipoyl(octanoyl) transferase LipB [Candidatus Neomarinimicrobiota bacterium]
MNTLPLVGIAPKLIELDSTDSIWENISGTDEIQYFWLGRQFYQPIWELQKQLHAKRVYGEISDVILLVEHEHVYTFGKNADTNNLLNSKPKNAEVVQIDRGGEVTYHGPGQLVCYPIIDLHDYKMSVSWYMRMLENVVIDCLQSYGIESGRKEGLTGVWVGDDKICAMGVRLSRWVTMHGFAFNLNPDMTYFDGMIPCGIFEYGVTSLQELDIHFSSIDIQTEIMKLFNNYLSKNTNEV